MGSVKVTTMQMNTVLAILLLGAAFVLCGNFGRRETEARAKAEDKLGHVSRVYEGYGGYERSRRSPLVGAPIGCTYEGKPTKNCPIECFVIDKQCQCYWIC